MENKRVKEANLTKNKTYKNLSENERLLLDLPLIIWSKKWEYGSIFMYNWFMQEGDIEMDDDLYVFLDKWKEFKYEEKEFLTFISKNKNKKINQEIREDTFRLYALNDLKKYVYNSKEKEIYIDRNFDSKYTNFSRLSLEVSSNDINNPYVASFGTFGIGFLLEGYYKKENEEITITNILEKINDRFDFEGSQVLGTWKNSIFKPFNTLGIRNFDPLDEILNIDNGNFRDFRQKTGLGKDYKIKGKRVYKNKFIEKIKINNNEIQYQ